jgi:polyphosphate glucokinase
MNDSLSHPLTLAVDVGGTGIKATVFDSVGSQLRDAVRHATKYPCPPTGLADQIGAVAAELPSSDRISVGFPGLLRSNRVVWVNSLTRAELNGATDDALAAAWVGYNLQDELVRSLNLPVLVANDADVAALASVTGQGLECVLTLGTGLGFSLVADGHLLPHLELSGAPFLPGLDFEAALGDAALRDIGQAAWVARVMQAVAALRPFLYFDHLFIGGGNARLLHEVDLGPDVSLVENVNGLVGGYRLWANS